MIRHGTAPYLECSSSGDKRFSAFYARVKTYNGRSIEDVYQAAKIFDDDTTGLNWRQAKGRRPVNTAECAKPHALLQTEIPSDPAFIALQFYAIASLIVECETDGIELGEFETRVLMMLSYPERFAQYLHRRERIKPPTLH